jgi:hypothetical protein
MRVNEDVYQCRFLDLYRSQLTLRTVLLYHKMQYVHRLDMGTLCTMLEYEIIINHLQTLSAVL